MGAQRASTDSSIRHLISGHRRGGSHMKRAWMVCLIAAAAVAAAATASPAAALVPDGTHGWFWQMPQPAPNMNDCTMVGAGNVWAVGTGGLIEHSTDGGATWTTQQSGIEADLWSVSFSDDQHGWAVGGQPTNAAPGVILRTIDGGTTWTDVTPAGLKETLTNASFSDAAHGYIGTTDGHVLKTVDAGASWQTLTLAGAGKAYDTVDFVDAVHGWAGGEGGRLWRTTNGGRTWSASTLGGRNRFWSIVKLDFVDRFDGWTIAQDMWGDSIVFATHDGGRSWQPLPIGGPYITDIHAVSLTNVWLVGEDGYDYYDLQSPTVFLHSTDGGFTWHSSTVNAPASPYSVSAYGSSVCAVGDGILHSSDAGATWLAGSSGQRYWFSGADAVSATDVWAVDTSGALLHSTDGARFIEQPMPAPGTTALLGVDFADAQHGWIVGASDMWGDGSVIFRTNDGGATWEPQLSVVAGEVVGLDALDASTAWAISDDTSGWNEGANVSIQHTTDGGLHWTVQSVPGNAALSCVDFTDASTGWAGGGAWGDLDYPLGAVFASTDGGSIWKPEKLPKGTPAITGLQFVSANEGWAVGVAYDWNTGTEQSGWVLHTIDGGATWSRVDALDDAQATTVHFIDASHGWLGGGNGVYATTDGGATWQRVAAGYGVEAIAATDMAHVWAFGDGFMTSTVDPAGDTAAPVTLNESSDYGWHRKAVTIDFSANDIGGGSIAATQSSLDGGPWQTGATATVPAYADHHLDGEHTVTYRSIDTAGNQEQTESQFVGIDTLGPACSVPRKSIVDAGQAGVLYFLATDEMSGVKEATISIVGAHHRVVRRFVERAGYWEAFPSPSYYWIRFRCSLKPGAYRVVVRALDNAGNHQVTVGNGTLRVVRSGAPRFHEPWWPPGLMGAGFASIATHHVVPVGFLGARLNHGLRAAWLLRQPGSPAMIRPAVHRGAWKSAHWPDVLVAH